MVEPSYLRVLWCKIFESVFVQVPIVVHFLDYRQLSNQQHYCKLDHADKVKNLIQEMYNNLIRVKWSQSHISIMESDPYCQDMHAETFEPNLLRFPFIPSMNMCKDTGEFQPCCLINSQHFTMFPDTLYSRQYCFKVFTNLGYTN